MVIHHELISKKKYQRSFWIDIKDIKQRNMKKVPFIYKDSDPVDISLRYLQYV